MKLFTVYRKGALPNHTEAQKNRPDEPQFQGVIFDDGTCVIRWLTACKSTAVWESFESMMRIHGHLQDQSHMTEVVWEETNSFYEEEFQVLDDLRKPAPKIVYEEEPEPPEDWRGKKGIRLFS